jgi:predicted O-linked N-acetylglucosamine transferase (SPINDLY family)
MMSRETSQLDKSLLYFRQAYDAMSAEEADKEFEIGLLRNWTLTNVFTVMGLSCYWQDFELFEMGVYHYAKAVTRVSEMTPAMDPYTFSLLRYPSAHDDLENNIKCCSEFRSVLAKPGRSYFSDSGGIRIGYLSYDWRDHPMGRLTKGLVTSHSKRFVSTSFSYGFDDHSDIREYVASHSNFVDLSAVLSNKEAAEIIESNALDILIDLTGHTYNNRIEISTLKPSAVVINYLGFPGSTGCKSFDYSMGMLPDILVTMLNYWWVKCFQFIDLSCLQS